MVYLKKNCPVQKSNVQNPGRDMLVLFLKMSEQDDILFPQDNILFGQLILSSQIIILSAKHIILFAQLNQTPRLADSYLLQYGESNAI